MHIDDLAGTLAHQEVIVMLYLIGLGLADERDITVKGLEVVRRADRVYLEAYTAILLIDTQQLVRAQVDMNRLQNLTYRPKVGSLLWTACHHR